MRLAVFIFLLSGLLSFGAEDSFFKKMNYEDALSKAKEAGKVVFIDFYTTWCAPCKMLDRSTWKDESVIAWLEENTVPLKIDAEAEVELARKYKVTVYPSLVFINPDGTEKDRLLGYRPADAFLSEAKDVMAGIKPIAKMEKKFSEEWDKDDPMSRMHGADELIQNGDYKKALEELLWCFDQGHKASPTFLGARNSVLLSRIRRLGGSYPPALQALRDRRDALLPDLIQATADQAAVNDFSVLNRGLEEDGETLKVYDRLSREKPDSDVVVYLKPRVYYQLLEARRYREINHLVPDKVEKLFSFREQVAKELADLTEVQRQVIQEDQHRYLMDQLGKAYQVLLGSNMSEAASNLADRMIALDPGPETHNILAWNGYLTGNPSEENQAQARKANELTEGQNGPIINTLARVLHARGQTAEAIVLLEDALAKISDPEYRKILNACLADLSN